MASECDEEPRYKGKVLLSLVDNSDDMSEILHSLAHSDVERKKG